MSGKCEQPLDELTVLVWLLYDHPNFIYCTLFISGTELRTDRRTDRRTDDPNTRCPRRTFQGRGIKRWFTTNVNSITFCQFNTILHVHSKAILRIDRTYKKYWECQIIWFDHSGHSEQGDHCITLPGSARSATSIATLLATVTSKSKFAFKSFEI